MKMLGIAVCLVVVLAAPSAAFASGVLVDARGKVEVRTKGGMPITGAVGLELPEGAVVTVAAGASAAVMLESGAIDQIGAGQSYTVGKEAPVEKKRTNLPAGVAVALRELAGSGEGPTVHGMLKKAGPSAAAQIPANLFGIAAIFPSLTGILLTPTIIFRWTPTPAVDWPHPALVIDDAAGKHIAVRPITPGSHELSVSAAAAGLKKGNRYSWYLATQEGALNGKSGRFEFWTLSAAKEQELAASIARVRAMDMSEEGKALLIGQLDLGMGLNEEAVEVLRPLWQKTQAPFVKKLLWLGYGRMARPEAEKYK